MSAEILSSRAMQWASKVQSIADQARDLTIEAAQSVGARYTEDSKTADINKLLEGRTDREKIEGLRRTIAISSRGRDMSEHFASVVKNVASPSLELRKLVYIYISKYAESQPDLALLSINTIQKALSDQNQIVRALAVRVMSSIRVASISGIVLLAIKKAISDSSTYVRKSAALAIVKTHALDGSLHTQLVDCLVIVLSDSSPLVLSSAIEAYEAICPDRFELLHAHYRRICSLLTQMDDLSLVNVLRVLERYSRHCFTSPDATTQGNPADDFYESSGTSTISADLSLLLKAVTPLLCSRKSAVVLAACRLLRNLSPKSDLKKISDPLLALLRGSVDTQYVVLTNIVVLTLEDPKIWSDQYKHFLVFPTDPEYIWQLKLEIISLIVSPGNQALLLSELGHYSSGTSDDELAKAAIRAIGKCAQTQPTLTSQCIAVLFEHLRSDSSLLVEESVLTIRQLLQLNPRENIDGMKTLARSIANVSAPAARASIFWLVSENLTLLSHVTPDVLRLAAKGFSHEEEQVRIQILTLAVKMYVLHCQHTNEQDVEEMNLAIKEVEESEVLHESTEPGMEMEINEQVGLDVAPDTASDDPKSLPETDSPIPKLYAYICQLARYDVSYDLRDRLRTYKVLASSPNWVLTERLLFAPKPVPAFASLSTGKDAYNLGSSSMVCNAQQTGYTTLAPWSLHIVGQQERNVEVKTQAVKQIVYNASTPPSRSVTPSIGAPVEATLKAKSKLTGISSLDDFYATTSEESDEEEEESDDTENDDGSESTSETTDDTESSVEGSDEEIDEALMPPSR